MERMGKVDEILREHSFLCNPRTSAELRSSIVRVEAIAATASDAAAVKALVTRLKSEHGATKVVHLSSLPDFRATLAEPGEAKGFQSRLAAWSTLWCCNMPPGGKGPGHIWYDWFTDVIPHKDRFGRNWEGAWVPKMGP